MPNNANISCIVPHCIDNNCITCPTSTNICTLCATGYALQVNSNINIGCGICTIANCSNCSFINTT